MSIYLYIKQHSVTGKLYFGKTTRDPEKYSGSGKHWVRHISKHGKEHVVTLWYCLFLDQESCTEFALNFSSHQNIVESSEWLNLQLENGLDGAPIGHNPTKGTTGWVPSKETRQKMSNSRIGKSSWNKGISQPDSIKQKIRNSLLGKPHPQPIIECPHCGKSGAMNGMKRYHFDSCKFNIL
jgi:hypothetical protein